MTIPAKKAGMAWEKSSQAISLNEEVIITPTITKAGAVAALGMIPATGAKKHASRNRIATVTEVKPVRPPSETPAVLST